MVLVVGAVLQLIGEMLQSAGSWQISFDLAPAHQVGQYQGFFGTGVPLARTLGPLLLTSLLVTWEVPGWLLLGALFLVTALGMGAVVRWAEQDRARRRPVGERGGDGTADRPGVLRTSPSTLLPSRVPPSSSRFQPPPACRLVIV